MNSVLRMGWMFPLIWWIKMICNQTFWAEYGICLASVVVFCCCCCHRSQLFLVSESILAILRDSILNIIPILSFKVHTEPQDQNDMPNLTSNFLLWSLKGHNFPTLRLTTHFSCRLKPTKVILELAKVFASVRNENNLKDTRRRGIFAKS